MRRSYVSTFMSDSRMNDIQKTCEHSSGCDTSFSDHCWSCPLKQGLRLLSGFTSILRPHSLPSSFYFRSPLITFLSPISFFLHISSLSVIPLFHLSFLSYPLHFCTPSFLSSLQLPFHSSSCFPTSCGLHLFPLSSLSFLFLLSLDFVGRRLFSLWTLRPWRRLLQTPGMLCSTLVSTCLPIVLSFRCLSWINVVKIYFFKRCD